MIFSVQQVKYEFLAYIKEFDPTFSNWCVGICRPAEANAVRTAWRAR